MCFFHPSPFRNFRNVELSKLVLARIFTCIPALCCLVEVWTGRSLKISLQTELRKFYMFFFYMFLALSQAQPSQASMKDFDGIFVQDLLKFFHRLGARQEAADAGLVQRDALLVVGLF